MTVKKRTPRGSPATPERASEPAESIADKAAGTMRFVTLNLWGENGPHERRLQLVERGLRALAPDVVALQEVREAPGRLPNQAATLARALAYDFTFAVAGEWGGGSEGLALLSRFPIREASPLALPHSTASEGRILLSARIAGPAGELWAHTTHLSYRMNEGLVREAQVQFVEAAVAGRAEPAAKEHPQVFLGDFNAVPESDEMRWLVGLTTLGGRRVFYQDAWATVHRDAPGWTWARDNSFRARMSWLKADRRLDYIFVTPERRDGRGRVHAARVVLAEPAAVDGVYPSDHAGVLADIQVVSSTSEEDRP